MKQTPWDFVEKYYPNYSSCPEMALNGDLENLLNGDQQPGDCADELLKTHYNGPDDLEIGNDYMTSLVTVYEKSIKAYMEQTPKQTN